MSINLNSVDRLHHSQNILAWNLCASLICVYLLWWVSTGQKLPDAVCHNVSMSQSWLGAKDAREIEAPRLTFWIIY